MSVFQTTRRTLLNLIGGLSVFRETRGSSPDTFTLIPQFALGQRLRYRQQWQSVRHGVIAHRARSTVTLEVLDRRDAGWLVRWTSSGSELLDADPRVRPMLETVLALWDGAPIDLVLGEEGGLAGLANPAAIRQRGAASLDRLAALLMQDPALAPMVGVLRSAMQATLDDDGVLAQSLLKEPKILLGAMGGQFRVGEPLEVRTRVPSPMAPGETIPVLARYQLRGISARDAHADISCLMVIDRATAARHLGAAIQDLADNLASARPSSEDEAPTPIATSTGADAVAGLDFDDRCDFIIDTTTAWPVRVHHVRHVSAGAGSQVDTVQLTQLGD